MQHMTFKARPGEHEEEEVLMKAQVMIVCGASGKHENMQTIHLDNPETRTC